MPPSRMAAPGSTCVHSAVTQLSMGGLCRLELGAPCLLTSASVTQTLSIEVSVLGGRQSQGRCEASGGLPPGFPAIHCVAVREACVGASSIPDLHMENRSFLKTWGPAQAVPLNKVGALHGTCLGLNLERVCVNVLPSPAAPAPALSRPQQPCILLALSSLWPQP